MDPLQRMQIELECTRLINQFAVFNDAGRFDELAALFVPDGRYARPIAPNVEIAGREAIQASFEARPAERVGRHLITNILVEVTGASTATGFCYATLYSGSTDKPAEVFGLQAQQSQFIGEFRDTFVKTDAGWKFASRHGNIVFTT